MTLWVKRQPDSNLIDLQITSGPIVIGVTKFPHEMRHFWHQLGQVLDDLEKEPGEPILADEDLVTPEHLLHADDPDQR